MIFPTTISIHFIICLGMRYCYRFWRITLPCHFFFSICMRADDIVCVHQIRVRMWIHMIFCFVWIFDVVVYTCIQNSAANIFNSQMTIYCSTIRFEIWRDVIIICFLCDRKFGHRFQSQSYNLPSFYWTRQLDLNSAYFVVAPWEILFSVLTLKCWWCRN